MHSLIQDRDFFIVSFIYLTRRLAASSKIQFRVYSGLIVLNFFEVQESDALFEFDFFIELPVPGDCLTVYLIFSEGFTQVFFGNLGILDELFGIFCFSELFIKALEAITMNLILFRIWSCFLSFPYNKSKDLIIIFFILLISYPECSKFAITEFSKNYRNKSYSFAIMQAILTSSITHPYFMLAFLLEEPSIIACNKSNTLI